MYVYIQADVEEKAYNRPHIERSLKRPEFVVFVVGHYNSSGRFIPESDHSTREEAAERVHWLNGGTASPEPEVEAEEPPRLALDETFWDEAVYGSTQLPPIPPCNPKHEAFNVSLKNIIRAFWEAVKDYPEN